MRLRSAKYLPIALALGIALLLMVALSSTAAAAGPQDGPWYGSGGYGCCQGYQPPDYCGCDYYPTPCCQPQDYCGCDYNPAPCCQTYDHPCCQEVSSPCCEYPGPGDCYYRVQYGDGLYRIALRYGTSWITLARANDLANGNYIYAGQVLRIPGCN